MKDANLKQKGKSRIKIYLSILVLTGLILFGTGVALFKVNNHTRSKTLQKQPLVTQESATTENHKKLLDIKDDQVAKQIVDDTNNVRVINTEPQNIILKNLSSRLAGMAKVDSMVGNDRYALLIETYDTNNKNNETKLSIKINKISQKNLEITDLTAKFNDVVRDASIIYTSHNKFEGNNVFLGGQKLVNGEKKPMLLMFDGENFKDLSDRLVNCQKLESKFSPRINKISSWGNQVLISSDINGGCAYIFDGENFTDVLDKIGKPALLSSNKNGWGIKSFWDNNKATSRFIEFDGKDVREGPKVGLNPSSLVGLGNNWLLSGNSGNFEFYIISGNKKNRVTDKIIAMSDTAPRGLPDIYYNGKTLLFRSSDSNSLVLSDLSLEKSVDIYPNFENYLGKSYFKKNNFYPSISPFGDNWLMAINGKLFTLKTTDVDTLRALLK